MHARIVQHVKHVMPQQELAHNVLMDKDLKIILVLLAHLLSSATELLLSVMPVIQVVKHALEKQQTALVANLDLDSRTIPVLNVKMELLLMEHFHVKPVPLLTAQLVSPMELALTASLASPSLMTILAPTHAIIS